MEHINLETFAGGAWKYTAMRRIGDFLAENLKEEINTGKIIVIA